MLFAVLLLLSVTCQSEQAADSSSMINDAANTAHDEVANGVKSTKDILNSEQPLSNVDKMLKFREPSEEATALTERADTFQLALQKVKEQIAKFEGRSELKAEEIDKISELSGCKQVIKESANCSNFECFHSHFRTFDGTCNNQVNPLYGSANQPFRRLLPAEYEDKISEPIGWNAGHLYNGEQKPSPRLVSRQLLKSNTDEDSYSYSAMNMLWGQFVDHDLDFTPLEPSNRNFLTGKPCNETCDNSLPCFPILMASNDPRAANHQCMGFTRSAGTCNSKNGGDDSYVREQINQITSFLDASMVYGSSKKQADDLRDLTTDEGKLRDGPMTRNNKPLLPLKKDASPNCVTDPSQANKPCFLAGDKRAMENIALTTLHILWHREHNRLVTELKRINPHWKGDRLYHEARKIVGAMIQHITYTAWLPTVLGEAGMQILRRKYNGYDSSVDPSISNVFATAAFRFGHARIAPLIYRYNEMMEEVPEGHLPLHKTAFAPFRINEAGIDSIIHGLVYGPLREVTPKVAMSSEVTENLFKLANELALDLGALNIQRGRDHGLPSYTQWRGFCGMREAESFDDLRWDISQPDVRQKLAQFYGNVKNIDLFVGGILEDPYMEAQFGSTFLCILVDQFQRVRIADRFWYEAPGQFTSDQLQEIKKANLARVICDNGDNIQKMMADPFIVAYGPEDYDNCREFPKINLEHWKETSRADYCF